MNNLAFWRGFGARFSNLGGATSCWMKALRPLLDNLKKKSPRKVSHLLEVLLKGEKKGQKTKKVVRDNRVRVSSFSIYIITNWDYCIQLYYTNRHNAKHYFFLYFDFLDILFIIVYTTDFSKEKHISDFCLSKLFILWILFKLNLAYDATNKELKFGGKI